MTVAGRATMVNVFPRVICYIPDLPEARLVYGRLLYCLPCCNFLADTEEGEPRTLHGDYFVGVGGVAPPSVVNRPLRTSRRRPSRPSCPGTSGQASPCMGPTRALSWRTTGPVTCVGSRASH